MKKKYNVYLDHASATPIAEEVLTAMLPYLKDNFGNPSSIHEPGVRANEVLSSSRQIIAKILKANSSNIIFTSGGTEANNLAICGVASFFHQKPAHIITSAIEHPSISEPLRELAKLGWKITKIAVDKYGIIDPKQVLKQIRPNTKLISIMYANNEIGAIQPIAEIGKGLLRHRTEHNTRFPYLHTDASQAAPYLNLDVEKLHVDLMTVNASKIYGPKGIGFLYLRRGIAIKPQFFGGEQEGGYRSGTENVPGIVGLAKALQIVQNTKDNEGVRLQNLSEYFYKNILKSVPSATLNGPYFGNLRLPNNLSVCLQNIDAETLVLYLSASGVHCSAGSACSAKSTATSSVLNAIGLSKLNAKQCLRFSLGAKTSKADVEYALKILESKYRLLQ